MRTQILIIALFASLISGCASDGTMHPMPSDLQSSPAQQNQAKLEQALTS